MKRGIWFSGNLSVSEMVRLTARAEDLGVETAWVAEGHYGRDPFVSLAAMAAATSTIQLGPGVVNPYTRNPAILAVAFATLDEQSCGRALVGIGAGARDQLTNLGYDASKGLSAVRESVEIINRLIAGEETDLSGRVHTARGVRLPFAPVRSRVPVWVAATGPKMCALGGEVGDAVYLPNVSSAFLPDALRSIADGIARRSTALSREVDIAAMLMVAVDADIAVARDRLRAPVGLMLLSPEAEFVLERNGLDPGAAERARTGMRSGGVRALAAEVGDELVDTLAIAGPAERCRDAIHGLIEAGVTCPVVSLAGRDSDSALDMLAAL